MSQEQDKKFFRNFTFVLIGLGILIAVFMVLGIMFGSSLESAEDATAKIMNNTIPVAKIQIQGDETEVEEEAAMEETTDLAATENDDAGKTTYDSICVACHGSGIPGIPQLGDADAWASRIAQSNDLSLLYEHAITGYIGASGIPMPAKGGNLSLSDDAVKAAVDYMVANSQ